jgi:urease accessory protein
MTRTSIRLPLFLASAAVLAGAPAAMAHPGHLAPGANALVAGAMHPLSGADHLLAMLASGLLAVRVGTRRALWIVPAAFVGLMMFGGLLALAGLPLPHVEWAISMSVIAIGLAVAMLPRVPLAVAAGWVGLFAICHGHAHVAEMGSASLLPYALGFVATTIALHASAIGAGSLALRAERPRAIRWAGAAIAICFAVLLISNG